MIRSLAKFSFFIVILLPLSVVFGLQSKLFLLAESSKPDLFVLAKFKVVVGLYIPLIDLIVIAEIWSLNSGIKDLKQVL